MTCLLAERDPNSGAYGVQEGLAGMELGCDKRINQNPELQKPVWCLKIENEFVFSWSTRVSFLLEAITWELIFN